MPEVVLMNPDEPDFGVSDEDRRKCAEFFDKWIESYIFGPTLRGAE